MTDPKLLISSQQKAEALEILERMAQEVKEPDTDDLGLIRASLREEFVKLYVLLGGRSDKDLRDLLRRGAAAIETPGDLSPEERTHIVEDLLIAAEDFED